MPSEASLASAATSAITVRLPLSVLPSAAAQFQPLYAELRRLAHRQRGGMPRTTLSTTALVHETYLRLGDELRFTSRGEFMALAAKAMRCVIIDHVRARLAAKRGAGADHTTLEGVEQSSGPDSAIDLLTVAQLLDQLDAFDSRLVSVVECRFFAGMEFGEIGATLGVSERTVQRDWRRARAFLETRLADARP